MIVMNDSYHVKQAFLKTGLQRFAMALTLFSLPLLGCTFNTSEPSAAESVSSQQHTGESISADTISIPLNTREPSLAEDRPIPLKSLEECTASAETPFSIGVLPQEDGTIEIHSYDMPPNASAIVMLVSNDPRDGFQTAAVADDIGHFELLLTPREYDYVRWNIFVQYRDTMHCQYVIMSGTEWLEQGYQGPETKLNDEQALEHDIALAAESLGVEPDVLRKGSELDDEVTKLNAIIKRNEADTYAGMRVDYTDGFRVIFAFTENGTATVANYVDDDHPLADYVVIEGSAYTETQLLADQRALNEILDSAEFPWGSAAMTSQGFVELSVPAPEVWEAFLAENSIELPPSAVVVFAYDSLPSIEPPADIIVANDVYMAQLKIPDMGSMTALNNDILTLEDGCLFAGSGDERTLIVWQPGYFPVEQDGAIVIVDTDGKQIAAVGDMLYMGGGYVGAAREGELLAPVPEVCQTDGSYRMGGFLPEEYRD